METKDLEKPPRQHDTNSNFRLVIIAALRAKQLLHGAKPRIHTDPARRKHTSIAMEEVKQQLVGFSLRPKPDVVWKTASVVDQHIRVSEIERKQNSIPV